MDEISGQPLPHATEAPADLSEYLGVIMLDRVEFRLYAVEWALRARLGDISLTLKSGRTETRIYLRVAELEALARVLLDAAELAELQADIARSQLELEAP